MRQALFICVLILLGAVLACGSGESDTDRYAQATIEAAIARIASAAATNEPGQDAPTEIPPTSPPAVATPTDAPTTPSSVEPTETHVPAPTQPPVYDISEVRNWQFAEQSAPDVVSTVRAIDWIADGIHNADEFNAAERLVNMGIRAPDALDTLLTSHTVGDSIGPFDLPALLSLQRMAQDRPERLSQLTNATWFRDGLTDSEAAIVAVLYERSRFQSPEFDDIVRDPGSLNVEIKATANRSGDIIPIAIVRSGPAPSDSPVMSTSQVAVPLFEAMFDAPFPTPAIVIHITEYVAGVAAGTNFQTHITLKTVIDANENPAFATHSVFHEIAHYYLYTHPIWYAEGGAEFAASYARHALSGAPIEATNSPCSASASLSDLESRLPADPGVGEEDADLGRCAYSLGERLMLALYRHLGEERFLQGWREPYHALAAQPTYPVDYDFPEVELRVGWLRAGGRLMQPELEHIWDQWYRGTASTIVDGAPDPAAPDPNLPSVNGRIDSAHVSLTQFGTPTDSFSASEQQGWVFLTLDYSYQLTAGPEQRTWELVEYFHDGYAYSRRSIDVDFEAQFSGGTRWLSLGPTPPQRWAPGRYWAYVYEDGRKISEVEYEVTP